MHARAIKLDHVDQSSPSRQKTFFIVVYNVPRVCTSVLSFFCHKGDLLDTMILFWVIIILQEDESPGVETLERIERTSTLIGANHKLRLAEVELQPYQYKGDNMGV